MYFSFPPYLSYGIAAWHWKYQYYSSKIFILQKKAIHAINNLAHNEHIPTHTSILNVVKYLNSLISISIEFRTTSFNNYYTPILMKKNRVYFLIIKFIAILQGPTTRWVYNAWIDIKQNIVSFTMVDNVEFFTWRIKCQRIICDVLKQGTKSVFKKNIRKYWCWAPLWLFFFF